MFYAASTTNAVWPPVVSSGVRDEEVFKLRLEQVAAIPLLEPERLVPALHWQVNRGEKKQWQPGRQKRREKERKYRHRESQRGHRETQGGRTRATKREKKARRADSETRRSVVPSVK